MKRIMLNFSVQAIGVAAIAGLAGTASAVELKNAAFRVSVAHSADNVIVVKFDDRAGGRQGGQVPREIAIQQEVSCKCLISP